MKTQSPPVVLVAHPNPELYGADRMLLETVRGLIGQGSKVIVTLPESGPLVAEMENCGATVVLCPTPVLRKGLANPVGLILLTGEALKDAFRGLRLIRRVRPDVVYVSTVTVPLWFLLARLTRCPVLSHVHEAEQSASRIVRLALAAPLLLATSIVANSHYSAGVLTSAIPHLKRRMTVIYNGVPGPPLPTETRDSLKGRVRLLYVGRLSNRKGVDVTIDAAAELRRRDMNLQLDIVGAVYPGYEWYEQQLQRQVEALGLTHSVRFHGFMPDVWPFLVQTDIVLVPSRVDEPFGNTAVEAILAARPLVVSQTSGLREAAGGYESPQFVPIDDARALADAVERITKDWKCHTISARIDSLRAARRHDPQVYRTQINMAINELAKFATRC
ncbi:glycosyltransferase family 4 protein [Arthrobacter sp. H14-L1]|uniref:glycosyltransferase family 4 protein n=1 Tax=Arthrobacter sp. H14-L1 TaxID=2996697 RepID=UPI00226F2482|nr:glycosyltransferase family 4 protein [Arthrobacter sp. H14-L1]MCY0905731.1 glycosyltransferase family 4 protein [Arthrobacter sp. H14-L1]